MGLLIRLMLVVWGTTPGPADPAARILVERR
jgi:hypothetical protein